MSELAREMIKWAKKGKFNEVESLLKEIESTFETINDSVVAFICTDFLVTILETEDKPIREKVKKLMRRKTFEAYQVNLNGYRESN